MSMFLAVTAPDTKKSQDALKLGESFRGGLSEAEIEGALKEVEVMCGEVEGGEGGFGKRKCECNDATIDAAKKQKKEEGGGELEEEGKEGGSRKRQKLSAVHRYLIENNIHWCDEAEEEEEEDLMNEYTDHMEVDIREGVGIEFDGDGKYEDCEVDVDGTIMVTFEDGWCVTNTQIEKAKNALSITCKECVVSVDLDDGVEDRIALVLRSKA